MNDDLEEIDIDLIDENPDRPTMRRLWSKQRMLAIIEEQQRVRANPLYLLRGWANCFIAIGGNLAEIGAALFTIFLMCLAFLMQTVHYVFFVVGWATAPIANRWVLGYFRARKYRSSLLERQERAEQRRFANQIWERKTQVEREQTLGKEIAEDVLQRLEKNLRS